MLCRVVITALEIDVGKKANVRRVTNYFSQQRSFLLITIYQTEKQGYCPLKFNTILYPATNTFIQIRF